VPDSVKPEVLGVAVQRARLCRWRSARSRAAGLASLLPRDL